MSPLSAATGWVTALLVLSTVALPSLARRRRDPGHDAPGAARWLQRHYWIGYTIAGLSVVHAAVALGSPVPARAGYETGVWIATGAMLIAFGQVALGRQLRQRAGRSRTRLHLIHVTTATVLVLAGGVHIWLDGAMLHALLGR
jgi:cytochrome b561